MTVPAFDMYGVCSGLGSAFLPNAIGTPSGASAMRAVFPHGCKGVASVPAVVLEVQDGTVVPNDIWQHHVNIDAVLLLSKRPGDPVRVESDRQRWLPYLLSATESHMKLGIGAQSGYEVKSAVPQGWEWTEYAVGADEYDAIRVHYQVWVNEVMNNLAP